MPKSRLRETQRRLLHGFLEHLPLHLPNRVAHGAATQNRQNLPDFRAHLAGKVSYVASVNPAKAQRLKLLFDQIDWPN